jgi:hypothetical protein
MHYDPVPEDSIATPKRSSNASLFSQKKQEILNQYMSAGRCNSTSKMEFDSLYHAEEDFTKKKLRNPVYFSNQIVK